MLRDDKLISERKLRQLLAWTHSGFSLDAGEKPVAPYDVEGRKRLAEYLLRAPFSLEKITWIESTGKVVYSSKRSWHTKRNFQIFEAVNFLAATVEHITPKGQQTVRYYGLYSYKSRGMAAKNGRKRPEMAEEKRPERQEGPPSGTFFILPAPEPRSGRFLRPLWRDLIMRVWGDDPHKCPCCPGTMKVDGTMIRRAEVEFFLRLHGLSEAIVALPPPPEPPFDVETMEPIEVPPHAIWRDDFEDFGPDRWAEADSAWEAPDLGDGRRLVL
ncbi:MAG: transposase [Akkermansiaceae bacterium]|nr:transposase [Akkermansiaceae bacterium]